MKTRTGHEQQNGSEQNIDGFTDGNGVEVAGEIAHGDNAHHLAVPLNMGLCCAAKPSPQTSGEWWWWFPLQHLLVIAAPAECHPVVKTPNEKMTTLIIAND